MASYQAGVARVTALLKQLVECDTFLAQIRERLLHAQDYMKQHYDTAHRDVIFAPGDWAWLRLHHRTAAGITDTSAAKLRPRFFGPYLVLERVGPVAYRLQLPPRAKIHNVFHVVFLKKYTGDPPASMVPLPPIVHGRVVPTPAAVKMACVVRGHWEICVSWVGRALVHLLILLGNIWRTSELRILIFSLRTSCFQRRVEMLWTLLLASSTNAGARSSRWLDQDLVAE